MTIVRKFSEKTIRIILGMIMTIGVISAQSACVCWFHQPEIPESMRKFSK